MRLVFADTFYWIAVTNPRDSNHAKAVETSLSLTGSTIVTSEPVLIEYLNYFAESGPQLRRQALRTTKRILQRRSVVVQSLTADSFHSGLRLYESRPDKGYSLTDCISMEMVRAEGIRDVLTNDSHFRQEGFLALFR